MHKTLVIMVFVMISSSLQSAPDSKKTITKNGMLISWHFAQNRVYFEMSAPTKGWITIGFNNKSGTTGAYLLMGRIVNGKVDVVEHFTSSPGSYRSLSDLGGRLQVADISGVQYDNFIQIKFSLPQNSPSKFQHSLSKGKIYNIILAYSQSDDFQHHSIMRTAIKTEL